MSQLRPEELDRHLAGGMAPVYLVAGEEPLIIEESLGRLRRAARAAGYSEREVLHADGNFDWQQLREARDSLSLFAQKRLIELRLPGGKPGSRGSAVLQEYAASPPADTLLLVITERLDARQRKSGWSAALSGAGAMIYAWPVRADELPKWIGQRMKARGLEATKDAVALLAERAEGNLLAAAQEIDKLSLVHDSGQLDAEAVRAAVIPNQRFDVFDLPAAARAGDRGRVLRVAELLRAADEPPTLVLWALARDLRVLVELQNARSAGESSDTILNRHRIPRPQQGGYTRLAGRSRPGQWDDLLARAARADAVIKGAGKAGPWEELVQLADAMAVRAAGDNAMAPASNGRET